MKLVDLYMTCGACPSQWEGRLEDGRAFYARYRHGWFAAGVGSTLEDAVDGACLKDEYIEGDGELVHCDQLSDEDDGVMSTTEMLGVLGPYLNVEAL